MSDLERDPNAELDDLSQVSAVLADVRDKIISLRKLLTYITDLDFSEEEALRTWERIFQHKKQLSLQLDREVNLCTAISDYFTHTQTILKNPLVVEYAQLIKLETHASLDFLTGIYNRFFFQEVMTKEMSRASRQKKSFSLALFDINGFKFINDTYGHQMGDQVLANVAQIIKATLRAQDIPCRYGGDEFICLLPETNHFYALGIIERLIKKISELSVKIGLDVKLSATYGLATYPWDGQSVEELIKTCDVRLYNFKAEQKDRSIEERRDAHRVKASGRGLLHKNHTDTPIEVIDVSLNGMTFKTQHPIEPDATYHADLFLDPPFSSAKVLVEVIHIRDLIGWFQVGARIKEIVFI